MRILIIKFWALGDLLMATPILPALKQLYKECLIDWLVDVDCAGILANNPYIDRIIPFDSGAWRRDYRHVRLGRYLSTSLSIRGQLKMSRYDIVINLSAEKWWSQWFNVAPLSVGLFPGRETGVLARFFDKVVSVPTAGIGHSTDHYLRTVEALGGKKPFDRHLILTVTEEDRKSVSKFLYTGGYDRNKPLIVLHPGASQETKRWPREHFTELADALPGWNIVVTGSPHETELANSVRLGAKNAAGMLVAAGDLRSIGETAALIERADVVITGDTSALHIASALNKKVVVLYGGTRPGVNEPIFGKSSLLYDDEVLCSPCYKSHCAFVGEAHLQCFRSLTAQRVLNAFLEADWD